MEVGLKLLEIDVHVFYEYIRPRITKNIGLNG